MSALAKQRHLDRTLGHNEAAKLLGVEPKTLYNWVNLKRIRVIKMGRKNVYKESDLVEFMERRAVEAVEPEIR